MLEGINLYFFVTAVTAFFALLIVVFVIYFAIKYRDPLKKKWGLRSRVPSCWRSAGPSSRFSCRW